MKQFFGNLQGYNFLKFLRVKQQTQKFQGKTEPWFSPDFTAIFPFPHRSIQRSHFSIPQKLDITPILPEA